MKQPRNKKQQLTYEEQKETIRALLSTFPSEKSFLEFKKKDQKYSQYAIPKFIKEAKNKNIIQEDSEKEFLKFIRENSKNKGVTLPESLSFGDLIEQIQLREELSITNLIGELSEKAKYFGIPEPQASMVTRLKQNFNPNTTKKKCLIRILAYWLGIKNLPFNWDYEQIIDLHKKETIEKKEGIVIAIKILSRGGDVVSRDAVDWLKNELSKCVDDLNLLSYINKKDIKIYSATSVCLRLSKKGGPVEEPRLYSRAIRNALAIGHQLVVRWILSDYSSQQRAIITGIFAGEFNEGDIFLRSFIESHYYKDSSILLTDYARLCAKVADVRVVFDKSPEDINLEMGLTTWEIKYFWVYTYYDFIPLLLKKEMLPTTEQSYERFIQELYFPEEVQENEFKALSKMQQFPQNTLLLLEIAKVCLSRRMFYEADAILAKILTLDPYNVIARMIRMMVYFNIALKQTNFIETEIAFDRAIAEGVFITNHPDGAKDEEVWSEFGLIYFGIALKYTSLLRKGGKENVKKIIEDYLMKAEKSFLQGMVVSPTGKDNRSLYWLLYTQALIKLLNSEKQTLFSETKQDIFIDRDNTFKVVGIRLFSILGWLREDSMERISKNDLNWLPDAEAKNIAKILLYLIEIYENSVLARNYIPNIKYAFCCLIWDFVPKLTVGLCHRILTWLEESKSEAKNLADKNLAIYSITASFLQFQSPKSFIDCIDATISTIKKIIPHKTLQQNFDTFIDDDIQEKISKVKLLFLHIDTEIKTDVLVSKEADSVSL